jgi:preprotein translocase subunit SecG
MLTVLIVVHLMLVIGLIGVVLLQKSEGGGLISSTSGFLSSRGTANVLSRTTALLAAGFFVTSLVLSWWASFQRHPASIINTGAPASQEAPAGTPQPPQSGQGGQGGQAGGLLNQLQKGIPTLPAGPGAAPGQQPAPAAPGGPQVPQSR